MQLPGLNIGIVADDLTGANDTALQFFLAGMPSQVLLDLARTERLADHSDGLISQPRENQVWSLNTQSRHLDKNAAEAAVRTGVALLRDRFGVENFYKKMDSTLRGHIAHECLGMLDELDADCAVIAPAFPQEGRRTVGGYQLVRGLPIERTPIVRDPLFPVRQSHLPTLLSQSTTPEIVGHISLSTVLHGAGPILVELGQLIAAGKKLVVVDATSNEDLEQIALAIEKSQKQKSQAPVRVIPCGSAGLAKALTKLWAAELPKIDAPRELRPARKERVSFAPSPILIVSGSTTEITRQQLVQLIENYPYYGQGSNLHIFDLSPEQLLGLADTAETLAALESALVDGNTVILSSALKEENYLRTLSLAREKTVAADGGEERKKEKPAADKPGAEKSGVEKQACKKAQRVLADLTRQLLARHAPKLILVGGETAANVCEGLDSHFVRLIDEAQPAIPLGVDDRGHWIITKSGSFGEPLALANLVRFIKDHETLSPVTP